MKYALMNLLADAAATTATTDAAAATETMGTGATIIYYAVQFVPLILIFVVFYFLLIRPQRKKDKEAKTMLDNLKVGDRICTIGGIYGRVVTITDRTVVIETSEDRVRMEFVKSAIGSVGTLDQQMAAAQRPAKKSKGEPVAEEKVEETTEDKTEE